MVSTTNTSRINGQLHTCSPPIDELNDRFDEYPGTNENFGHTLLVQVNADDGSLASALREYFESAHLDARNVFHDFIGIVLHPDAGADEVTITYPGSLPSTALRGLFGEVLAGLLTESYEYIGNHKWCIPIYLFRFHDDARNYLFDLARNPRRQRQTIGRLGSDFIGLSLNDTGHVTRIISGEAKWRKTLTQTIVNGIMHGPWIKDVDGKQVRSGKGVWNKVNNESSVPSGVRQLQKLLLEHDPERFDAAIFSLQRALILKNPEPIPKTDLIVISGNGRTGRDDTECLLPYEEMPEEYTAGNDLQIVEVIFVNGIELIDTIYDSLWKGNGNA